MMMTMMMIRLMLKSSEITVLLYRK